MWVIPAFLLVVSLGSEFGSLSGYLLNSVYGFTSFPNGVLSLSNGKKFRFWAAVGPVEGSVPTTLYWFWIVNPSNTSNLVSSSLCGTLPPGIKP